MADWKAVWSALNATPKKQRNKSTKKREPFEKRATEWVGQRSWEATKFVASKTWQGTKWAATTPNRQSSKRKQERKEYRHIRQLAANDRTAAALDQARSHMTAAKAHQELCQAYIRGEDVVMGKNGQLIDQRPAKVRQHTRRTKSGTVTVAKGGMTKGRKATSSRRKKTTT